MLLSAARRLKAFRKVALRNTPLIDLYTLYVELKAHRCENWRFFLDAFARRDQPVDEEIRNTAIHRLRKEQAFRRRFYRFHNAKLCTLDAKLVTARHFDGEIALE